MSKYELLWKYLKQNNEDNYKLSYAQIKDIIGFDIDHAFLTYKKDAQEYGYEVSKISMKEKVVEFRKITSKDVKMINVKFLEKKQMAVAYDNEIEIGRCEFMVLNGAWNIVHTEVNNKYQGQGIAKKLVECVIENAQKRNKNLIADCSYAQKIIARKFD